MNTHRTTSWIWRTNVNHNAFVYTTDLFGWAGPAATINRVFFGPDGWGHAIRIADRQGAVLTEITTKAGEETSKALALTALAEAVQR
jgi:hypothetical protein